MMKTMKGLALLTIVMATMIFGGYSKVKEVEKNQFETYKLVDEIHKTMEKLYFAEDYMTFKTIATVYEINNVSKDLQIFDILHGYSVDHEYGEIMHNWQILIIDENNNRSYVDLNCHDRSNVKWILWWYRNVLSPNYLYVDSFRGYN